MGFFDKILGESFPKVVTEYYDSGQKKAEGTVSGKHRYSDSYIKDGLWTEWDENGKKTIEENYKDDYRDGLCTEYYKNRQKKRERTYKNNSMIHDELEISWYENGQKKEEGFCIGYGEKYGKWTEWYENGQKYSEGKYKDGKMHGLWTEWFKNGQKSSEGNWKDGKEYGKWTEWHENGQKWQEKTYKDGKAYGKWTLWYDNGQKKEEGTYKGKHEIGLRILHGKWTEWYSDGKKKKEVTYKDGKDISKVNSLKKNIKKLLKQKAVKMPASDIDAHLKHKNVDEIKKLCEEMYQKGQISRTGNYRYFILTEKKKIPKPKKSAAKKSNPTAEIRKYAKLRDDGLITEEQYQAKAKELLGL